MMTVEHTTAVSSPPRPDDNTHKACRLAAKACGVRFSNAGRKYTIVVDNNTRISFDNPFELIIYCLTHSER